MARGTAQKEYRAACARVGLEIPKEEKAQWDAYAAAQGMPTGRMIRRAVERDMEAAGWLQGGAEAASAAEVAPTPKPAVPVQPKKQVKTAWSGITCMEED